MFIYRYSVFFGIHNTDVGIGFGILKYRGIGVGIGIPTHLYARGVRFKARPNRTTFNA